MNKETKMPPEVEMDEAYEEACRLQDEILNELNRVKEKSGRNGARVHSKLFYEIFRPEEYDREELLHCVVYHALISSSPPRGEIDLIIDLPGEKSYMAFARKKLAELKEM